MRAGIMRSQVDKSDVWLFRDQHMKQCDTKARGKEGKDNIIPTILLCAAASDIRIAVQILH